MVGVFEAWISLNRIEFLAESNRISRGKFAEKSKNSTRIKKNNLIPI